MKENEAQPPAEDLDEDIRLYFQQMGVINPNEADIKGARKYLDDEFEQAVGAAITLQDLKVIVEPKPKIQGTKGMFFGVTQATIIQELIEEINKNPSITMQEIEREFLKRITSGSNLRPKVRSLVFEIISKRVVSPKEIKK